MHGLIAKSSVSPLNIFGLLMRFSTVLEQIIDTKILLKQSPDNCRCIEIRKQVLTFRNYFFTFCLSLFTLTLCALKLLQDQKKHKHDFGIFDLTFGINYFFPF